ncbi:MAG: hypothetical protein J0M20_12205, partial [Burkholderiales bacterium]|nr:hypothetical protein [Burkholderiales bacterium]
MRWFRLAGAWRLAWAGLLVAGGALAVHRLDPDTMTALAQPAPMVYESGLHAVRPHQLPAYQGPADP